MVNLDEKNSAIIVTMTLCALRVRRAPGKLFRRIIGLIHYRRKLDSTERQDNEEMLVVQGLLRGHRVARRC